MKCLQMKFNCLLGAGMAHGRNSRHPVNDDDIRKVFGQFGEIDHIKTGSKDFVFIDYKDIESCRRAIDAMHGTPFDEHSTYGMKVQLADPNRQHAGGGYRRTERDRDGEREDDRDRDVRRRSRSPSGRGGAPGGYPADERIRDREAYPRPMSRSPARGDRRGEPLPPPPANLPYRDRSRDRMDTRERPPDHRAPIGGGFRDDMPLRGDRADLRQDLEHRREVDRRDIRPHPGDDGGYGRGAMPDSRATSSYPPVRERERIEIAGGRGGMRGDGGGSGSSDYIHARDPRADGFPGARREPVHEYADAYGGRDARDYDARREESRYPPLARDEVRLDHEYDQRIGYDARQTSYRPDAYASADGGRAGGGYRGEAPYEDARGGGAGAREGARDGGYGRSYDADVIPRERQVGGGAYPPPRRDRSSSGERHRVAAGPPPPRHAPIYDDRDAHRAMPRDMDRSTPRREPMRPDDYYVSGGGRGDDYPPRVSEYPPRAVSDAAYSRRDDYPPRRDGVRAPEGYREVEEPRGDRRPADLRGYGAGREDMDRDRRRPVDGGMDGGRMQSQSHGSHAHDDYRPQSGAYSHSRGAIYEDSGGWPRGASARVPDKNLDRRPSSPPRTARSADSGDHVRGSNQARNDTYARPPSVNGEEGMREASGPVEGAREVDSLPPSDLRRSLVRDANASSGSWPDSQSALLDAGAEAAPQEAAAATSETDTADDDKSEIISEVEAQRRRQRAERFSNPPLSQVCYPCICLYTHHASRVYSCTLIMC